MLAVARGLHPICSEEKIVADLEAKGLKILDATNTKQKR